MAEASHLLQQRLRGGQRLVLLQLFNLLGQQVMAAMQQLDALGLQAQNTACEGLVNTFKLVGQVADDAHTRHACATLEGMQVTLQGNQGSARLRVRQPGFQLFTCTFQDIAGLFQEDLDHLLIQRVHGHPGGRLFKCQRSSDGSRFCNRLSNLRSLHRLDDRLQRHRHLDQQFLQWQLFQRQGLGPHSRQLILRRLKTSQLWQLRQIEQASGRRGRRHGHRQICRGNQLRQLRQYELSGSSRYRLLHQLFESGLQQCRIILIKGLRQRSLRRLSDLGQLIPAAQIHGRHRLQRWQDKRIFQHRHPDRADIQQYIQRISQRKRLGQQPQVQLRHDRFQRRGNGLWLQQGQQGVHTYRLRRDLQCCCNLVHHADQGLMCLGRFAEQIGISHDLAALHGRIHGLQRIAQFLNLIQLGISCIARQHFQLGTQGRQGRNIRRIRLPLREDVISIQQQIHATGQELADQAAFLAGLSTRLALGFSPGKLLLLNLLDACHHLGGTRQGVGTIQIIQASTQHDTRIAQQLNDRSGDGNLVVLEFLDQLLQRSSDLGNWQDACHVRAAFQGVQRTLQLVRDRLRQFALTAIQIAVQGFQVGIRFGAEDLQQLRIQHRLAQRDRLDRRRSQFDRGRGQHYRIRRSNQHRLGHHLYGRRHHQRLGDRSRLCNNRRSSSRGSSGHWLPFRQGVRRGCQQVHIVTLTLNLAGIFIHQYRQHGRHIGNYLEHRSTRLDGAINHAVQHVFDRPGQLSHHQGTHHAATALEGMESAADFGQGLTVARVGHPARQIFIDGFQHFAGFFDEDFLQILIHRLLTCRRRQQLWRSIGSRRIDGGNRGGHHIGQGHGHRSRGCDRRWRHGYRLGSHRNSDNRCNCHNRLRLVHRQFWQRLEPQRQIRQQIGLCTCQVVGKGWQWRQQILQRRYGLILQLRQGRQIFRQLAQQIRRRRHHCAGRSHRMIQQ